MGDGTTQHPVETALARLWLAEVERELKRDDHPFRAELERERQWLAWVIERDEPPAL